MANTKKYVSLDKLGLYDEKIKGVITAGDEAALDSAKAYADSLAKNYEAAGSIATAKSELEGKINGVEAKADAAQAAADVAQGEVDALEVLVGTLPTGTEAKTIVEYVNKKTEGIATDTALSELQAAVDVIDGDVATIKADYLKASDKTELSNAINTEKSRAEGIEAGLRTDVDGIKADYLKASDKTELQGNIDDVAEDVATIAGDYLKASDKTELQGNINAKAAQTALDAEIERATGVEAGLQTQINTIMNNPDAEGAINSINEFTTYITEHGNIADGFRTDINKNKDDIAAMDTAYKAADTAIKGRLDVLEAIDHDAYIAADTALKNELNGEVAKKADASALTSAVQTLEGVDTGLGNRITALENKFGGAEGSVEDLIADAKQEAIDTAAGDATTKANKALTDAKSYTDGEIDKVEGAIATLTETVGTKAAQSEVNTISGKVGTLESDMAQAKTDIDAVEALAAANKAAHEANAAAIALKASQSDLEAVSGRVTTLETWHSNFVECSQEDINGLFTA